MLERSNEEERAAKCNICSAELSIIENMLYGNRCVFCLAELSYDISTCHFLALCWLDHRIYRLTCRLIHAKGLHEARMLFLGCIAEAGELNIAGVRTVGQKRQLIKILRRF